jgi:hypothetical protein
VLELNQGQRQRHGKQRSPNALRCNKAERHTPRPVWASLSYPCTRPESARQRVERDAQTLATSDVELGRVSAEKVAGVSHPGAIGTAVLRDDAANSEVGLCPCPVSL